METHLCRRQKTSHSPGCPGHSQQHLQRQHRPAALAAAFTTTLQPAAARRWRSSIAPSATTQPSGGPAARIANFSGALQLGSTILNASSISNSSGTITSLGYNLSSDDGGGFLTATGDQINTTPMLGPLQDNGGPIFTHALLTGSPAIDAGDPNFDPNAFNPPMLYDQRGSGYDRVAHGRIDIGAFEVQATPYRADANCQRLRAWASRRSCTSSKVDAGQHCAVTSADDSQINCQNI